MAVATVPEKQNNKFESKIKTNKGEGVPLAGDIAEIATAVVLKKQNTHSEKDDGSAPMSIAAMTAPVAL